jgi:hypothetical protein
LGNI